MITWIDDGDYEDMISSCGKYRVWRTIDSGYMKPQYFNGEKWKTLTPPIKTRLAMKVCEDHRIWLDKKQVEEIYSK